MSDTPNNTKTSMPDSTQKASNVEKVIAEVVDSPESNSNNSKQGNSNQEINLANIIKFLDLYLVQKSPSLPKNVKDFCFKYLALFSKISIVLVAISTLFTLPFFFLSPLVILISVITNILFCVLIYKAMPKIEKAEYSGWEFIFKVFLLFFVLSVFSYIIEFNLSGILFSLMSSTICFYFLFQIRSYYKIKA